MFNYIINKLDKRLKIKNIVIPNEHVEEELLRLDISDMLDILISVDGMNPELANRVIDKLDEIMGD